jgi:hypothetical protein
MHAAFSLEVARNALFRESSRDEKQGYVSASPCSCPLFLPLASSIDSFNRDHQHPVALVRNILIALALV